MFKFNELMWLSVMFMFVLIQLVSGSLPGEVAPQAVSASKYVPLYNQINEYLEKNVKETYVDYNIQAAKAWLANLKSSDQPEQPLVDALELLTSLTELKQDTVRCSWKSYRILSQNYLATGTRGLHLKLTNRRVDDIVYYYCHTHAKQCKYTYGQNYETLYDKMDKRLVGYVKSFLNPIMFSSSYPIDEQSEKETIYRQFVLEPVNIGGVPEAKITYDTLLKLAEYDSKGNFLVESNPISKELRRASVRELFDKYLIKPCIYYVKQLDQEIFIPTAFDNLFQSRKAVSEYPKENFYQAWARVRFCKALIDKDQGSLFSNMMDVIERKTH